MGDESLYKQYIYTYIYCIFQEINSNSIKTKWSDTKHLYYEKLNQIEQYQNKSYQYDKYHSIKEIAEESRWLKLNNQKLIISKIIKYGISTNYNADGKPV